MLYTYTIDQEFNDTTSRANYFIRDSTPYNFKSVKIEGDIIDYIFIRPFWQDTFIWQLGSYFNWTESPRYYYSDFVLFSDVISNKIYKFSEKYGMQVLFTNSGDLDDKTDTNILEPGSNGILVDPKDNDILYIAQHYNHRIVRKNINTPHKVPCLYNIYTILSYIFQYICNMYTFRVMLSLIHLKVKDLIAPMI